MKLQNLKTAFKALSLAMPITLGMSQVAQATEPSTPFAVPNGASVTIPAGANPPPGDYLTIRGFYSPGDVVDGDGNPIGSSADVTGLVLVYSHVWDQKIWGASNRSTFALPITNVDQNNFGSAAKSLGVGNVTVSPVNLSWMTSPGIFVSTGLSFSVPVANHAGTLGPDTANNGTGAFATTFSAGISYLRDGWNLTANAMYTIHGEAKNSNYKNGDQLYLDLTAIKNVGNDFSVGLIGFTRQQVKDDVNNGTLLGGTIAGRTKLTSIGLAAKKDLGRGKSITATFLKPVVAENTRESTEFGIAYSMPIGK